MSDWVILGIDCSLPQRDIFAWVSGSRLLPNLLRVFLGLLANALIIPLSGVRQVTIRSASLYFRVLSTIDSVFVNTIIAVLSQHHITLPKSSGFRFFSQSSSSSLFLIAITCSSTKMGAFTLMATAIAS